jgi:hypothetical protein
MKKTTTGTDAVSFCSIYEGKYLTKAQKFLPRPALSRLGHPEKVCYPVQG